MTTLFWLLIFLGGATALAYHRTSLKNSTIAFAAALVTFTLFGPEAGVIKVLLWLVLAAMALLNVDSLRREHLTRPILATFRKIMPEMSDTEKTALEAGTVWWDGELFSGKPDWGRLLSFPRPSLSEEEEAFLNGPVAEFCSMCDEWQITHVDCDITPKAWEFLKKNGFFAMIIPKKYGGREFSALAHSEVLARIAGSPGGGTAASIVAVPNSLGPAELLLHYGTEEQKNHYLPRLAKGEEMPCFALTSPHAGSDAGSIPDTGIVCKGEWQGKEVIGMKLTWDKRYITLAPVATVLGLAFKMYDPEGLLGDQEELGITCALIPTDTAGVEIGRRHFPLNTPFQNGPTRGKDVFVPLDYIIGGRDMIGQGWRMLMECLAVGRSISLPSMATGGSNAGALATGAYARVRRQFNVHIGAFEGVQEALARIGGRAYASEAVRTMTAMAVDMGEKPSVPSAIAKYHCTDMAQKISIDAMDVHGGKGVMLGPNNYLGRGYQSAPIAITVEGANILTRSMIIFGQGAIRCHPFVLREMMAAREADESKALAEFDQAFFGHIGHVISSKARAFWLGLTNGRGSAAPVNSKTRRCYQKMNRYSADLAFMADMCMAILGGSLKFRESISARLGDVLARLYIVSATLKRYEDDGCPDADLPVVRWVAEENLALIETALDDVLRNLPYRLGYALRLVVFPLGRRARSPADADITAVANLLQTPNATRDRIGRTVYFPEDENNQMRLLDTAMRKIIEVHDIEKRLLAAFRKGEFRNPHPGERIDDAERVGAITSDEAVQLREAYALLMKVISVDDFDSADLARGPAKKSATSKPKARKTSARKTAAPA